MSFSKEIQEKIEELRRRVKNELVNEDQNEDHFLIRWLRARNMNIDKAEEMLRKSLKWRRETGADDILETEEIPDEFKKKFMVGVFGEDQKGCPIFFLPAGIHDYRFMIESEGMETAQRRTVALMENVMKITKDTRIRSGKPVYSYHKIVDMKGYSLKKYLHQPSLNYIIEWQKTFESNYPDIVETLSVINASKIFTMFFAILKPFIASKTLEKVTIYGENKEEWKEAFVKKGFPMHKFPPNWGGTLEGSDEFCSKESVWLTPPIPLKYFKEVQEVDNDGFYTVKVGARDKLELKFPSSNTTGTTTAAWKFLTEGYDIGFQLSFLKDDDIRPQEEIIIPMKRVDSQKQAQEGSKTFDVNGTFKFVFDNRYSFTKPKTLRYQINLS